MGKLTSTTGIVILFSALVGVGRDDSGHDGHPRHPADAASRKLRKILPDDRSCRRNDLPPTMPRKPRKGFPMLTGQTDEKRSVRLAARSAIGLETWQEKSLGSAQAAKSVDTHCSLALRSRAEQADCALRRQRANAGVLAGCLRGLCAVSRGVRGNRVF